MKAIVISFFIYLICPFNKINAQPKSVISDPAINMLTEFYVAYNTAWSTTHNGFTLIKKIDSLQTKYCTVALRKKLKSEFKKVGLDHDELINDMATDIEHLNTLKIIKDPKWANEYIVSYMVFGKDASNKPLNEKIVIHVLVMKEGGSYKLAAVKNATYTIVPTK